jgi:hypothetical protein
MKLDQAAHSTSRIHVDQRTAYHLAGQAAAICLGNQQKQLPEVYFQIIIQPQDNTKPLSRKNRKRDQSTATIEGGRLIQNLPVSFTEANSCLSYSQQEEYRLAFEADIINLLSGPLAEAKYVACRDDEAFSANLISLEVLQFYGGRPDLAIVLEYMQCLIPYQPERGQKLAELFLAAFNFVNQPTNWLAISALAKLILNEPKRIIHCEEVIAVLEPCLAA